MKSKFLIILIFFLLIVAALFVGSANITPYQMLIIIGHAIKVNKLLNVPKTYQLIFWQLRLPRVLLVAIIGMSLGLAGAIMQGLLRNPLADPALLGISSGAGFAAVLVMVLFGDGFVLTGVVGQYLIPLAAFVGCLVVTFIIVKLAKYTSYAGIAGLLLIGVALNALFAAGITILLYLANSDSLRQALLWTFGNVNNVSWGALVVVSLLFVVGSVILLTKARVLNVLALGEDNAYHLGVDVNKTNNSCVLGIALIVGASVAVAGPIAFVGLVVPHIMRMILGPSHKKLLFGSMIAGGILLLLADMVSRIIIAPRILPLGIMCALLGAPFFLWLLLVKRS